MTPVSEDGVRGFRIERAMERVLSGATGTVSLGSPPRAERHVSVEILEEGDTVSDQNGYDRVADFVGQAERVLLHKCLEIAGIAPGS
jgi:hypothetical protein